VTGVQTCALPISGAWGSQISELRRAQCVAECFRRFMREALTGATTLAKPSAGCKIFSSKQIDKELPGRWGQTG
jgi:hypothetical protein